MVILISLEDIRYGSKKKGMGYLLKIVYQSMTEGESIDKPLLKKKPPEKQKLGSHEKDFKIIREPAVIKSDASSKQKLTIMPTITASGDRLPFAWIAKGTTQRCINKLVNIPKEAYTYFSPNGWINEGVFLRYLREVVSPWLEGNPCALLVDSYGAHWTAEAQRVAASLNIELIEVPHSLTHICQPLDISFNGPMKQKRVQKWTAERHFGENITDNVERTVMRAFAAFQAVQDETISKGFVAVCPQLEHKIMHRYRPRR